MQWHFASIGSDQSILNPSLYIAPCGGQPSVDVSKTGDWQGSLSLKNLTMASILCTVTLEGRPFKWLQLASEGHAWDVLCKPFFI